MEVLDRMNEAEASALEWQQIAYRHKEHTMRYRALYETQCGFSTPRRSKRLVAENNALKLEIEELKYALRELSVV